MKPFKPTVIGRKIKIMKSRNEENIGIQGTILDETRNTLLVETSKGQKIIVKSGNQFKIDDNIIDGNALVGKPEERIKQW